jgi:type II secretory pathway pseudopilin PulG
VIAASRRVCAAHRWGLTLVEVLVVIAVITVLFLLLVPAVQSGRESARRNGCANNLKQLAMAAQQYVNAYGVYPSGIRWQYDPVSGMFWTSGSCLLMMMEHTEYKHV